jgi:predicted O-methyltransferase YrrM
MNPGTWTEVDGYIAEHLLQDERAIEEALGASEEAGLPSMAISPNEGKFLELLARVQRANNILELGTLGGYSTIWLARALPKDGRLVTLE